MASTAWIVFAVLTFSALAPAKSVVQTGKPNIFVIWSDDMVTTYSAYRYADAAQSRGVSLDDNHSFLTQDHSHFFGISMPR